MVFSSYVFLFRFLPLVLGLYYAFALLRDENRRGRARLVLLLTASYVFYGWERPDLLVLIAFSSAVDWFAAARIDAAASPRGRKAWLLLSIVTNLSLLGFFKYFEFGLDACNRLLALAGKPALASPFGHIVLPVGISFYTFQSMSYTIDVYRRVVERSRSPLAFFSYVALFPQLVAGPIVRYSDLADQLHHRRHGLEILARGILVFMVGFAKKTLLANPCGILADSLFRSAEPSFVDVWCGMLAYALQIYFDFSGYSDMAIGLGRMFGFEFPVNFDSPYKAESLTDFWRRWHISLSTWLRDYLYIPLGGNRSGSFRTGRNLMLTMLLGGLWHGAAWTFVLWGAWHGLWLAIERRAARRALWAAAPRALRIALTFLVVVLGWMAFRAGSLGHLGRILAAGAGLEGFGPFRLREPYPVTFPLTAVAVAAVVAFLAPNTQAFARKLSLPRALAALVVFVLGLVAMLETGFNPFLYYQF